MQLNCSGVAEEYMIQFDGDAFDNPILQIHPPADKTVEVMSVDGNGLSIRQQEDDTGAGQACGFKVLLTATGDFTFDLAFACSELQRVNAGWGQGLVIRIPVEDKAGTVVTFGWTTTINSGPELLIAREVPLRPVQSEYIRRSYDFSDGTLRVQRDGERFDFSVIQKGESTTVESLAIGRQKIGNIEVAFTRQKSGNAPATYLVKNLAFKSPNKIERTILESRRQIWWTPVAASVLFLLIGLAIRRQLMLVETQTN